MRRLLRRALSPFRGRDHAALDRELDEEIRFHVDMRTRANLAEGMEPKAARRAAERAFGDPARVRRAGREILADAPPARDGAGWLEGLLQDARFALRTLSRNPIPTAVAVLSLALGIGANSANFSVIYAILLRPLPFADARRIVYVDTWNSTRGVDEGPMSWAELGELRRSGAFDAVAGFDTRSVTVTGSERPERIAAASVTPDLFSVLGVQPARGRAFRDGEGAEAGFEEVVMIGDGLWKRLFGADPEIVGKSLHLNGRELVIVGVMPPGFRFPEREDLWLPMGTDDPGNRRSRSFVGVGKLAAGVSVEQAAEAAETTAARYRGTYPDTNEDWHLRVRSYRAGVVNADGRQMLLLLLVAVAFVLLLACANVANLMLARATERGPELAVRAALGAGRGRLVRQMLTEAVLLGVAGGLLGLGLAFEWVRWIRDSIPDDLQYWMRVSLDRPVLLYTAAVAVGTGLLFGILPAIQGSRATPGEGLQESGRGKAGSASGGRLRGLLVAGEVALAVVLLVSAALTVRSFLALQDADAGFDDRRVLSFRVLLTGDQYDPAPARTELFRNLNAGLEALPGVDAAAVTSAIPADDGGPPVTVAAPGAPADEQLTATAVLSTDGLFDALGVSLLAGRDFTVAEVSARDAAVAILGASLARRLGGINEVVGRAVHIPELDRDLTVIGVAPDLQYEEFGEETERSVLQVHLPYAIGSWRGTAVLVRTDGDPAALIGPARDVLASLDPTQAAYDILTMEQRRRMTTAPQRVFGQSFAIFGAFALLLAFCGTYAVIAYSVSRRTREMGVRIALGARPGDVRRHVVARALRLTGAGLGVGLVVAFGFSRAMRGMLFGVSSGDPMTFIEVAGSLLAVAALAAWIPATRAAAVDPIEALRSE